MGRALAISAALHKNICSGLHITLRLKNDTDVAHYKSITSMHINRFWYFLADMLLREYGDLLSHLTNVSTLPGET